MFSTILEHDGTRFQLLHGNELIRLVALSSHGARPAHDGWNAKSGNNTGFRAKGNVGRVATAPGLGHQDWSSEITGSDAATDRPGYPAKA
ncbi:MAG: hypothetical protein ABJH45_03465 [Paracoccaceae bacterium]